MSAALLPGAGCKPGTRGSEGVPPADKITLGYGRGLGQG